MEQLEQSLPAVEDNSLDRSESVERLRVAALALEQPESRASAAKRLNSVLSALARGSDAAERPALAASVLAMLDDPQFKLAVDDDGIWCRVSAVGALLAFGYPWALQLHPDDLAFYRQKTKPKTRPWVAVTIVALLAALGMASAVAVYVQSHPDPVPPIEQPAPVKPVVPTPPVTLKSDVQVVPNARVYTTAAQAPMVRPLPSLLEQADFAVTAKGARVSLLSNAISEQVVLEHSNRPEVKLATRALVEKDANGALSSLESCLAREPKNDACAVLKIIALRMRDTDMDLVVAEDQLRALRQRSPKNPSLPGLTKLLGYGTTR